MNFFDQLAGFAFCTIRPGIAVSLIPFGNDGALGVALRVPLVLTFASFPAVSGWPANLMQACAMEALAGLVIGLLLSVVFHVAAAGGAILDQQGGYSIGAVYDPNFQQESALFETLFTQFAALTFFTGQGLVMVSRFFVDTWSIWPPGLASQGALEHLFRTFSETRLPTAFLDGMQLAAPLLALMIIVDISMGLASRHARRLNPFAVARSVKAMVLSLAAMACVPALLERLERTLASALTLGWHP
ncbi:EscT/YscT/HrcT family type III secretion system export apparatus protein [Paraburkholderia sacchari]|uniref:Flagellar biosynthetic protein FliR n=1 Tax=Paraburkholderia sacchari TaxID=159450 RepID=A0A8T6ZMK5_9BURK|nr:flagellar biosynthetic protein FliR [Paraburkholderia sacchari]NLP65808.1 flagellar biosynthetic protein FliR [Paraburkholderia sacchari]